MPSILIIDDTSTFPTERKVTRWSEMTARLRAADVQVSFAGVDEGSRLDLQAATSMGTIREAIDLADLVIVGPHSNQALSYWTLARRGGGGLPLVTTTREGRNFVTDDLWPAQYVDALQRVTEDGYLVAIDRVIGTAVAARQVGILEPAVLPASVAASPDAYTRFGVDGPDDDVPAERVRFAVTPATQYEAPAGRIAAESLPRVLRQALFVGIAKHDSTIVREVLAVVRDSAHPNGPINIFQRRGGRPHADWALFHLAVFCPEDLLAEIPEGELGALWDKLSPERAATTSAVLKRGGRLLESARRHIPDFDAMEHRRSEAATAEHQADVLDLRESESFYGGRVGLMGDPAKHTSICLTFLGHFPVPDILQLEESIPAAIANPHYLVAGGRTHGFLPLLRELTGLVQTRAWASRRVQESVTAATQFFPPQHELEMAEWDDFLRGMRSKSLKNAIMKGADTWPLLNGPLTDLFHQRERENGDEHNHDKNLMWIARRTLDLARRDAIAEESRRLTETKRVEEERRRLEYARGAGARAAQLRHHGLLR